MFEQFCLLTATPYPIQTNESDMEVPTHLETPLTNLIRTIKPHIGFLHRMSVPFVEQIFREHHIAEIADVLEKKTENGDIPDGLINSLSKNLYQRNVSQLSDKEQAIIKVLSVYLMIQN